MSEDDQKFDARSMRSGVGHELTRQIAREHANLGETLRGIETELARLGTAPGRSPGNLIHLLASFEKHLRNHFAFEEEGGPLKGLGDDTTASRLAAGIVDDHRRLEAEISKVLAMLASRHIPPTEKIVDDVRAFLHALREHEVHENAVFEQLLYRKPDDES